MQTKNAAKIGVWIVIAAAILIFGTRYFQGLALGGTKTVVTHFDRVDGLISGNTVQMRGVRVGNVASIRVVPDSAFVEVRLSVNRSAIVRQGAVARLSGIASLGDMRIEISTGTPGAPEIPDGGRIPSEIPVDLVKQVQDAAGGYMETVDAILARTEAAMTNLDNTLDEDSDIQGTLAAFRDMTEGLSALLEAESAYLSGTIRNLESVSANLDSLTSTSNDSSVAASLQNSMARLDQTLAQTQSLTANLDTMMARVNAGEGTLGLLANDESLYHHMDSVAANLSRLLEDFRRDPKRYLQHVKAVDIF